MGKVLPFLTARDRACFALVARDIAALPLTLHRHAGRALAADPDPIDWPAEVAALIGQPVAITIDAAPEPPPMTIAGARFCADCGCTDFDACVHPEHGACWWVAPNQCSHCKFGWGDK